MKLVFNVEPIVLTTAMIATEMPAAIRPYSMAVAPLSSLRKRKTRFFTVSLPCILNAHDSLIPTAFQLSKLRRRKPAVIIPKHEVPNVSFPCPEWFDLKCSDRGPPSRALPASISRTKPGGQTREHIGDAECACAGNCDKRGCEKKSVDGNPHAITGHDTRFAADSQQLSDDTRIRQI